VDMQWTGDYDCIDVLLIQQLAVVIEDLDVGSMSLGLRSAPAVSVGDGYKFRIGNGENLFQQFGSATAHADHTDPHTVVRAQHTRGWIHHECSSTDRRLF